jgi:sterol desaturase/sphingolipid hydroxylase (fatty acid hydroxylase superfamily)
MTAGALLLFLAIFYGVFFAAELKWPLRRRTVPLARRLLVNLLVSVAAFVAALALVHPAGEWSLAWTFDRDFGLMNALDVAPMAEFVATFLLLDLSFYYWHLANHRIGLLWRMHAVHRIARSAWASRRSAS